MRVQWSDFGVAAVLVGGACALLYAGVQRSLRRAIAEQQEATDRQIAAMATTVKALQTHVAELNRLAAERAGEFATIPELENAKDRSDEMKPEMLAVITAAATTFLGKAARIRSAKLVPVHDSVSAWTQQGRMIVQTSHNLRTRD
jgi:hypothetical protein